MTSSPRSSAETPAERSASLTAETAAQELYSRRRARENFCEWARLTGVEPAAHHQLLAQKLEAVARGEIERLAVFMPPGSAKSTYVSALFPPWYLAQHPTHSVLLTSHTYDLAESWGRRARNLVDQHGRALGLEVDPQARAASLWLTTSGAQVFAAGVGGAIAGYRADLGIIDDPVRSREDAESKPVQSRNRDWYHYDFVPRLKPDARRVLIQTRWSEADLAGTILEEEGEAWTVLCLPMIAESDDDPLGRAKGERLWPEWFKAKMVEDAQRDPRVFAALYQQRPAPETGAFFKRTWLRPVPRANVPDVAQLRLYGASDYATTRKGGDWTVHVVLGVDPSDRPWLLELWREQASTELWVDAWCRLVRRYHPTAWAEERGQIASGVGPFLEKRARELKAFVFREQFASRYDKAIRAQSIRGHIATNGLWYAADAPWREVLEHELLTFPASKHDDIVDALSLVGQLLDQLQPGRFPTRTRAKPDVGYRAMQALRPSFDKAM